MSTTTNDEEDVVIEPTTWEEEAYEQADRQHDYERDEPND